MKMKMKRTTTDQFERTQLVETFGGVVDEHALVVQSHVLVLASHGELIRVRRIRAYRVERHLLVACLVAHR